MLNLSFSMLVAFLALVSIKVPEWFITSRQVVVHVFGGRMGSSSPSRKVAGKSLIFMSLERAVHRRVANKWVFGLFFHRGAG
jgi:hypothetical protein